MTNSARPSPLKTSGMAGTDKQSHSINLNSSMIKAHWSLEWLQYCWIQLSSRWRCICCIDSCVAEPCWRALIFSVWFGPWEETAADVWRFPGERQLPSQEKEAGFCGELRPSHWINMGRSFSDPLNTDSKAFYAAANPPRLNWKKCPDQGH